MNILITGASGFVASNLLSCLNNSSHDILCLSRDITNISEKYKSSSNLRFLKIDITKENLSDIQFDPEIVINLASAQPSNQSIDWNIFYEANVKIVEALIDYSYLKNVKRFLHISTTSVYSSSSSQFYSENSTPNPTSLYSLSKFMGDSLLRVKSHNVNNETECAVLRFPSIFGQEHLGGLVHTYYSLAKLNKDIEIYNEGKTMRNLLYIDHAIETILLFINSNRSNKKYDEFIAGSSNSLSSLEIASYIKNKLGSSSALLPVKKSTQINEDVYLDLDKLKNGYSYKSHTIEEGLSLFLGS